MADGSGALVLTSCRGAPQKRIGPRYGWTREMETAFFEVLADTCNVTLAARAIGRSTPNVYRRKATNASFRASWDAALAMGYSRLEMMLLERALHGVEKRVVARDGTTTVMREYSDRTALTLLRMHRETVALAEETIDRDDVGEAADRIIARLKRMRADAAGPAIECEAIETKANASIVELVRWGLRH